MKIPRIARKRRPPRAGAGTIRIAEIVPPEGVPLHFEVAGLGGRLGAQIVDILITFGLALAIVLVMAFLLGVRGAAFVAITGLLFFLIRVPYYVATELLWNGQTVGKRISALRVMSGTGRSLSAHQVVARNLMKEVEVFLPATYVLVAADSGPVASVLVLLWIVGLIAVPVFNRRRQRIGDIIAETIVVHQPRRLLAPDLAAAAPLPAGQRFVFLPNQLEHYGAFELQVLERVLQSSDNLRSAAEHRQNEINLGIIFDRIRAKIGYSERVAGADRETFLRAFYAAQRAYLEQRRLFGDVRADKFYKEDKVQ